MQGPLLGTESRDDREEAKVEKMMGSIGPGLLIRGARLRAEGLRSFEALDATAAAQ